MPLRPSLLDLRQYPLCERPLQTCSSLEGMVTGETLIVVNDHDPHALLQQLRPILERNFTYWITEDGPQTWRIIFSRESNPELLSENIQPNGPTKLRVKGDC